LKLRLPGCYRPGKEYPQQLIYNTGNSTTVEDVLEVFKQVWGREVTDTLWENYKQSLVGRIELTPDQVLVTPDQVLKPKTVARTAFKATSIKTTNLTEEIAKIDRTVSAEDFTRFDIILGKKTAKGQFVITPQGGSKGTSCVIFTGEDGVVCLHSFGGDIFQNGKSTITYSTLWKHCRGYAHSTFKEYARAFLADHNVYLDDGYYATYTSGTVVEVDAVTVPDTVNEKISELLGELPGLPPEPLDLPPEPPVDLPPSTPTANPKPIGAVVNGIIAKKLLADVTINQKYLSPELLRDIPPDTSIVAIKSEKGTGKTTLIKTISDEVTTTGGLLLVVVPTRSLGRTIAYEVGITYRDDWHGGLHHVSLCLHSLHDKSSIGRELLPLVRQCEGHVITVLDESEYMRTKLLGGDKTLGAHQLDIIDTIGELGSLGRLYLLDADLTPDTTRFYANCIRQSTSAPANSIVTTYTIHNTYKQKLQNLMVYPERDQDDKPITPANVIQDAINDAKEDRAFVLLGVVAAEVEAGKGKYASVTAGGLAELEGVKHLVVDANAVQNNPLAAKLLTSPTATLVQLKKEGYKLIIVTIGILQTGVSIDSPGLFTSLRVSFSGLTPYTIASQFLWRDRDIYTPRYVHIAKNSHALIGGHLFTQGAVLKNLNQKTIEALYGRVLEVACPEGVEARTQWLLQSYVDYATEFNNNQYKYRSTVLGILEGECETIGYTDLDDGTGEDNLVKSAKATKDTLKGIKDIKYAERVDRTVNAKDITPEQARMEGIDKCELDKFNIQNITGEKEVHPDQVRNYHLGYFLLALFLYQCTLGYAAVQTRDKARLSKMPRRNPLQEYRKVAFPRVLIGKKLMDMGLEPLLGLDQISNESQSLVEFVEALKQSELLEVVQLPHQPKGMDPTTTEPVMVDYLRTKGELVELVGKVAAQSPIDLIKKIFKVFGIGIKQSSRTVASDGGRLRNYKVVSSWVDAKGNKTKTITQANAELFSNWLHSDLKKCLEYLLKRTIEPDEDVMALVDYLERTNQLALDEFFPIRELLKCIRL